MEVLCHLKPKTDIVYPPNAKASMSPLLHFSCLVNNAGIYSGLLPQSPGGFRLLPFLDCVRNVHLSSSFSLLLSILRTIALGHVAIFNYFDLDYCKNGDGDEE